MSHEIWKFKLGSHSDLLAGKHVTLPKLDDIIHAELIGDEWFIWGIVELDAGGKAVGDKQRLHYRAYGTGWPMDASLCHVVTQRQGSLVWHLFSD